jgi:hypothetical protein
VLLIFKFCLIFLYYGNVRDCERGSEEAERGGSSSRNTTEKRGLEVEKKTTRSACFPFDRRLPCSLSRSLSLSLIQHSRHHASSSAVEDRAIA